MRVRLHDGKGIPRRRNPGETTESTERRDLESPKIFRLNVRLNVQTLHLTKGTRRVLRCI